MSDVSRSRGRWILAGLLLLGLGCGKVPPAITEVEGVVTLDGAPLPSALVQFMPELDQFGAEMNSTGITDEKGRFKLTCAFKQQPGAAVGKHRVLITNAPPPEAARGMSGEAQAALTRYLSGLKNRPIPDQYGSVAQTPLIITVEPGQATYNLTLARKKL
jgi:hypothetical protein